MGAFKFRKDVTINNFTNVMTALKAGSFNEAFKMTIGAKQKIAWGYGSNRGAENTEVPFTIELRTSDNTLAHASVRLVSLTPSGREKGTYTEFRTENAVESVRDKPYAIKTGFVNELGQVHGAVADEHLAIKIKPDSDVTIDLTKSKIIGTLTAVEDLK